MPKAVNKTEFWKARLERAEETKLHYSVYEVRDPEWEQILKSHLENLTPYFNSKVLDAGCGYGRLSEYFIDYMGVDFSPEFIAKAQHLFPSKKFLCASLESLPFKDKEFDVSFCISIRQMIEANCGHKEWMKMEKELKRVSKKVLIMEYGSPEDLIIL